MYFPVNCVYMYIHILVYQVWDLAGQDHFRQMSRTYFRGASGCVMMFDVTRRSTFDNVAVWKADLDSKVVLPSGQPIPCILVANKVHVNLHCTCIYKSLLYAELEGTCGYYHAGDFRGFKGGGG